MEYQEFLNQLQKRGSKPHKLGHCLGTRDAWKWVRHNHWQKTGGEPVDQLLYSKIINEVNQILVEQMLEGHVFDLPYQMGSFLIASKPARVEEVDGELLTNYRTDWKKTLQYFYEDEEGRNQHKTIKRIQTEIYYIKYSKKGAKYHNRMFYKFRANRSFVKKLGAAVGMGVVHCFKAKGAPLSELKDKR